MPILSFRVSVPAGTQAQSPCKIRLTSQARAIQQVVIWSPSAGATFDKAGFRLSDYASSKQFIPDSGSDDNSIISASGESGWAPLPSVPLPLDMHDQLIEGVPYHLNLSFYNKDAGAILVAGFIIVHEPYARIEPMMLYEILTQANPRTVEASGQPETVLQTHVAEKKQKPQEKKTVKPPGAK